MNASILNVAGVALNLNELAASSISQLTTVYNFLADKNVKKLTDKATAVAKVKPLLVELIRSMEAAKTTTTKRTSPISKDAKIALIVASNPKKPGSAAHSRFAAYTDGMTIAEAVAAGLTFLDFRHDVANGFIAIQA